MSKPLEKTLVIVAHPDDEAISCGGLIQNRLQQGNLVSILVMCNRRYPGLGVQDLLAAQQADRQALKDSVCRLSHDSKSTHPLRYNYYDRPEGEPYVAGYYDWLGVVEKELQGWYGYDEVVIPSPTDLNQDHRHLSEICTIALRPANLGTVKQVLMWHALDGGTPASANWFEPMTQAALDTKQEALTCYQSEVRAQPHPRAPCNIHAHAMVCGSQAGYALAEPYTLHLRR